MKATILRIFVIFVISKGAPKDALDCVWFVLNVRRR